MGDKQDKLEVMKGLLEEALASVYYGIESVETTERSFTISTKGHCGQLDKFRDLGADHLALCEGHEVWWQVIATSLDPRMSLKVKKALQWGDEYCQFVCKLP